MSSKWKYADLDASHRLELLKKGNKELFEEEVARTKEVTEARRELGLDTSAQENWMDTVGYNYNLSLAGDGDKVSETGYAQLYLDGKKQDTQPSPVKMRKEGISTGTSYISNANKKIEQAQELAKESLKDRYEIKKREIRDELYEKYPYLKEQIVNEGASPMGGKLQRAYDSIEKELADIYSGLEQELTQELAALDKKYSGIKSKVMEYRRNGTALESLGVIADVLIRNAAAEDGFDSSVIPGMGGNITVRNIRDKAGDKSEATNTAKVPNYKKESGIDDEYDESEGSDGGISVKEEVGSGDPLKYVADYLKKAVSDQSGGTANVIRTLGEMLVRNGMNPQSAVLTAAELVMLIVKNAAQGT